MYFLLRSGKLEANDEIPFSKLQWHSSPTLGQVVGAYKSHVWTECLKWHQEEYPGVWLDKIWQRNYDERIIRNTMMFHNITTYIIQNPANWKEDLFYQ